jgi:hypothetical protein
MAGIVISAAIAVIVVLIVVDPFQPPSVPFAYVVRAGTMYSLAPLHYNATDFSISFDETLLGALNASHGVYAYVLTPSQYDSLSSSGQVQGYTYSSGNLTNGVVDVTLRAGSYYLVFYNANPRVESQVKVINDFNTS